MNTRSFVAVPQIPEALFFFSYFILFKIKYFVYLELILLICLLVHCFYPVISTLL